MHGANMKAEYPVLYKQVVGWKRTFQFTT